MASAFASTKVTPEALARSVISALRDGLKTFNGDIAKDLIDRWKSNPRSSSVNLQNSALKSTQENLRW